MGPDDGKVGPHNDPTQALGAPDETNTNANPILYVSLGDGGELALGFTNNVIVDGDGPDVYVMELGQGEKADVYVKNDCVDDWVFLGVMDGATSFDLAGSGLTWANAIWIVDWATEDVPTGFPYAGVDIDGVIALNSAPETPRCYVDIDIKPGSYPNSFNINGHGVIPVAILGSEDFDVTCIDPESLTFSGLDVAVRGKDKLMVSYEDVSGGDFQDAEPDGFLDMVIQFQDDATLWQEGDTGAVLEGQLYDDEDCAGTLFYGIGTINVVPPVE